MQPPKRLARTTPPLLYLFESASRIHSTITAYQLSAGVTPRANQAHTDLSLRQQRQRRSWSTGRRGASSIVSSETVPTFLQWCHTARPSAAATRRSARSAGNTRHECAAVCSAMRWGSAGTSPLFYNDASATKATHVSAIEQTELKEAVLACIPRAPLLAKATVLYQVVAQYDPELPTCTPWSVGEVEAIKSPPSGAYSQRHNKAGTRHARLIRLFYGSFKNLLLEMASERWDCGGSRVSAAEAVQAAHADSEDVVYRGGDGPYNVYVSCDLTFVTVAASAQEAGCTFARAYEPLTSHDQQSILRELQQPVSMAKEGDGKPVAQSSSSSPSAEALPRGDEDVVLGEDDVLTPEDYCYPPLVTRGKLTSSPRTAQMRCRVLSRTLQPRSSKVNEALIELYIPYFGDDFVPPPPPPSSSSQAPSSTALSSKTSLSHGSARDPGARQAANTFTPQQIGMLLPTFFVPMDALLAQLPAGYTPAHVRAIFSQTGAVEVVQLGNDTFVRFHGGKNLDGFSSDISRAQQERFDGEAVSSDDGADEEAKLRRYIATFKPDPYHLHAFLPRFRRPFQWVPLYELVQHAPPAVQNALLPLQQQRTLLYFAQQQHRVQFTPQRGGAVTLCCPPTRSLHAETTPLPQVLAEVSAALANRGVVYTEEIESDALALSDFAKRHIIAYFGTLRRFLFQHERHFRLSVFLSPATVFKVRARTEASSDQGSPSASLSSVEATTKSDVALSLPPLPPSLPRPGVGFITAPQPSHVQAASPGYESLAGQRADALHDANFLGITSEESQLDADGFPKWLASRDLAVQLEDEAKLRDHQADTLEERLEGLSVSHGRRKMRKVRRRLAAQADPNSPFNDPAVLLDAILRYLPPTRHISLRALLASLPMSMQDFLPNDPVRLFRNAPEKVQIFEYRQYNHLRLIRPGLPLPDGRLRTSYTSEELIHLMAMQLQPGQSKAAMTLYGCLPYWARETIRLQHQHITMFAERHPEYFIVVFVDALRKKPNLARISLMRAPPPLQNRDEPGMVREEMTLEEQAVMLKADREVLLAELPPELRRTVPSEKES